jgi:hypothetical protein
MAFQIPLMRKDFDIYKMNNGRTRSSSTGKSNGRSRKVSESTSMSTSPGHESFLSPRRTASCVAASRNHFSRVNSRTSQSSLVMGNGRSYSMKDTTSPPRAKADSQNSLNKFHNRLVDRLCKAFKKSSSREETRS